MRDRGDEPLEDVDVPARQGNRIGIAPPDHRGLERDRQAGGGFQLADQHIERGAAGLLGLGRAAFERLVAVAVVEHGADLGVHREAQPLLDRQRDQRRDPVGQIGTPKTATSTSEMVAAMLQAITRWRSRRSVLPDAVEAVGIFVDSGDERRITDFEAGELCAAGAAKPHHVVGRRLRPEFAIGPVAR